MRFTTFLIFASFILASARAADVPKDYLNVIIILADDLGYGDLHCYGHPTFKTPNLDRLAAEGARLTDFYSTCPYCAPSRASLMTGRYQFRSGLTANPAPDVPNNPALDKIGLPDSEITLAQCFQRAGYATCAVGKWHLGHQPQFFPTRRGFGEYLGILYSNDMRPVRLFDGDMIVEYPVVQSTLEKRYAARACDFIKRHQNSPFFLYVPGVMPHKPLAASEVFYKKTGTNLYGDAVAELDWSVGQILSTLHDLDLDDKTLVLFTSDNGPWYGGSTAGLRGMKGNAWEGGIREPLIARWPGHIPRGLVSHEPAAMIDLFPTTLTATDHADLIPADRPIDGKVIMPLLTTESAKSPHDALFSMQGPRLTTIRSGPWKLFLQERPNPRTMRPDEKWTDPRAPDGVTLVAPYEQAHPSQYPGVLTGDDTHAGSLFNLEIDASEQHDVSKDHPDIVQRLQAIADEMNKQVPQPAPPPAPNAKTKKAKARPSPAE